MARHSFRILLIFLMFTPLAGRCQKRADEVDVKAEYPGRNVKMYNFILKHFRCPSEAVKANVSFGAIIVKFAVDADGSLHDFNMIKDPGFGAGEELIRVIRLMPQWRPGEKNGKPVRSEFVLPLYVDTE